MKKGLLITAGVIVAFSIGYFINCPAHSDGGCKIAVVDINELAKNSTQVQQLKKDQDLKLKDMQSTINKAQLEISKEKDKAKVEAISEKYRQEINDKKVAMDEEYNTKLNQINDEIKSAVVQKASQMGYDVVLPKNVTLFGGEDITSAISAEIK
ncbi:MAG: OmpH family outer membrane protein [Clostridiaceae bacterium]|nr:OmpH family outer membrane protein [Clostridiaceae bacterium]